MIEKLLKAKHWQLVLFMGIAILFMAMGNVFPNIAIENNLVTSFIYEMITLISFGVYLSWIWSVAIGLQTKLPEGVKMKVKQFKISFIVPFIFVLWSLLTMALTLVLRIGLDFLMSLTILLGLLSVFGIFHAVYFVAKTIKTVELQRQVSFGEFVEEFIQICFFPMGVWFLQPLINKLIEE